MGKPQVDIQVDDLTGRWSVDALPMILVPQHFFLNNHRAIEAVLGPERLAEVLRPAGYRSAYYWCEREAAHHALSGLDVFQHYMRRLIATRMGPIRARMTSTSRTDTPAFACDNSALVDDESRRSGRRVCYMFAAWLVGSLEYAAAATGRAQSLRAHEACCAADGAHDHCEFEVSAC